MKFAVIITGGKQYKVAEGDTVEIEKLDFKEGEEFDFDQVLMVGNGADENLKIGKPIVEGARVHARVMTHGRDKKKIIFKFSSKTRYKKKKGHRQPNTRVVILAITA